MFLVIDFNFTDDVKAGIKTAIQNFKATTESMDLSFILYDKMGKNFLKQQKFSPDGFMQLGLQVGCIGSIGSYDFNLIIQSSMLQ